MAGRMMEIELEEELLNTIEDVKRIEVTKRAILKKLKENGKTSKLINVTKMLLGKIKAENSTLDEQQQTPQKG